MLRQVKRCVQKHINVLYDEWYLEFVDGGKTSPVEIDLDAYASKVEFKKLFISIGRLMDKGFPVYYVGPGTYIYKVGNQERDVIAYW